MKSVFCRATLLITTLLMIFSCGKTYTESEFKEFRITDASGTVRECGIYLPVGYSDKQEFPVIYMFDGLIFKDNNYKHLMDSLIGFKLISPVVIACTYENKEQIPGYRISYRNAEFVEDISKDDDKLKDLFDKHYSFATQDFIKYVEKHYGVQRQRDGRIFYGTSNSADFGITVSMRDPSLFAEYWCYSPVYSDLSHYGMLEDDANYRLCWGLKEEGNNDYFPALVNAIRKRGGHVYSWAFEGGHDRIFWRKCFKDELIHRFPYK